MSPDSIRVQGAGVVLGWKTAAAIVTALVAGPVTVVTYLDNRFDALEAELAQRPTIEAIDQLRHAVLEIQIRERLYDAGVPATTASGR